MLLILVKSNLRRAAAALALGRPSSEGQCRQGQCSCWTEHSALSTPEVREQRRTEKMNSNAIPWHRLPMPWRSMAPAPALPETRNSRAEDEEEEADERLAEGGEVIDAFAVGDEVPARPPGRSRVGGRWIVLLGPV
jgi:hypothetical protein